jgi:uncharacterized damage-inducible protein DinB
MLAELGRLFVHMAWADQRVVDLLGASPAARQPAILRVFSHLLAAERVWWLRVNGEDSTQQPIWPEYALEELNALAAANASSWAQLLGRLTEGDLRRAVSYRNSQGTHFETPVLDILWQVALHGSYHRGQIAAAVRAAGAEPVNTDFITFARQRADEASRA